MNKYQNIAPVAPSTMTMPQRQMAVNAAMRPSMMHLQAVGQAAPAAPATPAEPKKIEPIKFVKENWQKLLPFIVIGAAILNSKMNENSVQAAPTPAPPVKKGWGK